MKRVGVINDISCLGRCSLTVALPILNCGGIHTNILPTTLLSTQTGGYSDYYVKDLTDTMLPIAKHFQSLNIKFDALYSGYLGNHLQSETVLSIFEMFKPSFILVDPVLGDNGELYKGFSHENIEKMKELCKVADLIVPNITEACLLTGNEQSQNLNDKILSDLKDLTNADILVTGIKDNQRIYSAVYSKKSDSLNYLSMKAIDGMYHGTGDVFASVLLSGIIHGKSLIESCEIAQKFVYDGILRTKENKTDTRQGIDFEMGLKNLANMFM